ncbi:hypothetical protein K470DRAFT_269304 [Piedraia hortae CBS 480.64]|uniref:Uncharacterized protein n=1 Tax=Piedraia hortae CBS 480.64 TaxID=1314780 RepID=A0A6A7C3E1_9PEZI|nr:hypothetical protein K470DRAFT_269304 [Piedraia hortae CBS 480.64]
MLRRMIKRPTGASSSGNIDAAAQFINQAILLFCTSPANREDADTFIDALESSPDNALHAAQQVRKCLIEGRVLGRDRYKLAMLAGMMSDIPSFNFHGYFDKTFSNALKESYRATKDGGSRKVFQIELNHIEATRAWDPDAQTLIKMWREEKERLILPDGLFQQPYRESQTKVPEPRLPLPKIIEMKVQYAMQAANDLIDHIDQTPTETRLHTSQIKALYGHCQRAHTDILNVKACDKPPPDSGTMQTLSRASTLLYNAEKKYLRAMSAAERAFEDQHTPLPSTSPRPTGLSHNPRARDSTWTSSSDTATMSHLTFVNASQGRSHLRSLLSSRSPPPPYAMPTTVPLVPLKFPIEDDDNASRPSIDQDTANISALIKHFCEYCRSGQEQRYLPAIVEIAESAPTAASDAFCVIKQYLSNDEHPAHVLHRAVSLMGVLSSHPGEAFTRFFDEVLVRAVINLYRTRQDYDLSICITDRLNEIEARGGNNAGAKAMIDAWKQEKARSRVEQERMRLQNRREINCHWTQHEKVESYARQASLSSQQNGSTTNQVAGNGPTSSLEGKTKEPTMTSNETIRPGGSPAGITSTKKPNFHARVPSSETTSSNAKNSSFSTGRLLPRDTNTYPISFIFPPKHERTDSQAGTSLTHYTPHETSPLRSLSKEELAAWMRNSSAIASTLKWQAANLLSEAITSPFVKSVAEQCWAAHKEAHDYLSNQDPSLDINTSRALDDLDDELSLAVNAYRKAIQRAREAKEAKEAFNLTANSWPSTNTPLALSPGDSAGFERTQRASPRDEKWKRYST